MTCEKTCEKEKDSIGSKLTVALLGIGLGLSAVGTQLEAKPAWAKKVKAVKCLGVAAKKMNDCGSKDGAHTCSGKAKRDNDPNEWVYLPKDACKKLAKGKVWEK